MRRPSRSNPAIGRPPASSDSCAVPRRSWRCARCNAASRSSTTPDPLGGIDALRAKSIRLTDFFIGCVEAACDVGALTLETPREPARRGSQVSFGHAEGFAVMQALIARGVIGDFRAGDAAHGTGGLVRFGFAPLYTRFVDAWDAADALADVLGSERWREARFQHRERAT